MRILWVSCSLMNEGMKPKSKRLLASLKLKPVWTRENCSIFLPVV